VNHHAHFVEIKRLSTRLERCRGPMMAFRRITFIGHDASKHTFTVQYYQNRADFETEERGEETKPRVPSTSICRPQPLSPACQVGWILYQLERIRAYNNSKQEEAKEKEVEISRNEFLQVRLDAKNEVEAKYIPKTVISNTAANSFLHWSLFLGTRPQKVLISRETGLISSVESSPPLRGDKPFLGGSDVTPFRLTPNIQDFITPIGVEGLLTSSLLAISRGLLEPECDVQKQMWLLIRDDFMLWFKTQARDPASNERLEFRVCVAESIERIIKRMSQLSASNERAKAQAAEGTSSLPTTTVVAPIQQLINTATNPAIQSRNHDLYYPWF
ncbi:5823_t:CDS:2, partial [Acaulospora colombiana]